MALINYYLALFLAFASPIFANQGFYITGKRLYYSHESGTPIARKNDSLYQGFSNIPSERQQKATDFVSKGKGIQVGAGYTFAKHYHLEWSYLSYGNTFKQHLEFPASGALSELPFNNFTRNHNTSFTDPHHPFTFFHTTRGMLLVGQRNLFQLHPRINIYGGGGIALFGQYNRDSDDPSDTPKGPLPCWSLFCKQNDNPSDTEIKGTPIDSLVQQEQQEWRALPPTAQGDLSDKKIQDDSSSILQAPFEKWSLSLILKGGVLFHITNRLTVDLSYSLTFKKYHLLNIDTAGTLHMTPPTLDADTLNFFQIGVNYRL